MRKIEEAVTGLLTRLKIAGGTRHVLIGRASLKLLLAAAFKLGLAHGLETKGSGDSPPGRRTRGSTGSPE